MRGDRLLYVLEGDCQLINECVFCSESVTEDCVEPHRRYETGRRIDDFLKFVTNYYAACLTSLSATALELPGGALYTRHWVTIPECNKPVCIVKGSSWSEAENDCIFGAIANEGDTYDPQLDADLDYLIDSHCMPVFDAP